MANQFYVGQRVRETEEGEGVVTSLTDKANPDDKYPIKVEFDRGIAFNYTECGRFLIDKEVVLTPIDPSRTVLTDWQENRLKQYGLDEQEIEIVNDVLSQPEPPKYVPKEGEAVLYESNIWMAGVFTNMVNGKFRIASGNSTFCVDRVIPFDSSLHGSNVND